MTDMHALTKLTPESVARKTGFLDWGSQPSMFKHYPTFLFRYKREDVPSLDWLFSLRHITSTQMITKSPYRRLNVPSAGNLHPLELYVQIRGVKGVLSGIYHIDVLNEQLVLIRDLEKDGVEPYIGMQMRLRGVVLMVSIVPFRSYWKYGLRSWRYLYLDAGHQLAALMALSKSVGPDLTLLSDFDADGLDHVMGLEDKEAIVAVLYSGEHSDRKADPIDQPLMHVLPTDYVEEMGTLQKYIREKNTLSPKMLRLPEMLDEKMPGHAGTSRRSAREFAPIPFKKGDVERFMNVALMDERIDASAVVLRAEGDESGIYHGRDLYRKGMFDATIVELLVRQRFIAHAAMLIILHAVSTDAASHLEAGIIGHWLYLVAQEHGVACTGIGAYYDDDFQEFLEVDGSILYVIALGARP